MTGQHRTPPGPPDLVAAAALWEGYAATHPDVVAACPDHTVEHFGDSEELADELLGLVLAGGKRATSALVADFLAEDEPLPRVGSHWIACDGRGRPRIVIRSTELRIGTFDGVDPAYAADEGEGDLSLESWRREHRRYWTRSCAARGESWSQDQEIVLERFVVVWPPEHADPGT
ncbi:ASCH domain-containing protein [Ornithinimicrobium sp. W1679]|uniref:ASCH domain-containing protein n=1 Tax=Ornithinimicrobium sp. W1679 TaxID=3418770 RepID=UPI003CEE7C3B